VLNLDDSGPGSLRQAVLDANAHPGPDTIRFAAGLQGTIALSTGELTITDSLTIAGPGSNRLTVSGSNASRVFHVSGNSTVTFRDLTIADGAVTDVVAGAGILNKAGSTLTLDRVTVRGNVATAPSNTVDVFGGGLLNEGRATVVACDFHDNQALGGGGDSFFGGSCGGAIDNYGGATLTLGDSRFTDNQALGLGAGNFGIGGAVESNSGLDLRQPSTAIIDNCLFLRNQAGGPGAKGNGGAIDNEGTGAFMTLSRCLVADNLSGGSDSDGGPGGGVMNFTGSTCYLSDCTIRNNLVTGGTGGTVGNGGGIENATATMTVASSMATRPSAGTAAAVSAADSGSAAGSTIPPPIPRPRPPSPRCPARPSAAIRPSVGPAAPAPTAATARVAASTSALVRSCTAASTTQPPCR
jgi:hypothetical protein